jgi:hypothetical protein
MESAIKRWLAGVLLAVVAVVVVFDFSYGGVLARPPLLSFGKAPARDTATSGIRLGAALGPAHMTKEQLMQALQHDGVEPVLFQHAGQITTQYGSWRPSVSTNAPSASAPGQPLPTADYWTVTLTNVVASNGKGLIGRPGGSKYSPPLPPAKNVTMVIDDSSGHLVEVVPY